MRVALPLVMLLAGLMQAQNNQASATGTPQANRNQTRSQSGTDQGHFSLEGVVAKQMDKQVAEMQAKSVANVFSVTNNLRVEE